MARALVRARSLAGSSASVPLAFSSFWFHSGRREIPPSEVAGVPQPTHKCPSYWLVSGLKPRFRPFRLTAERAFDEVVTGPHSDASTMIKAMRSALSENDMMAYFVMMAVRLIELHWVL